MKSSFKKAHSELQKAVRLLKCRKCGCLRETLTNLKTSLPSIKSNEAKPLLSYVKECMGKLKPLEYPCFGCKYCIPAEAMSILTSRFPSIVSATLSGCEFSVKKNSWPPVAGEYTVLNKSAPVAVSTLASVKLEEKLAKLGPDGLCIIGKTETENIGIDKIVKNVITNPAIKFLVVAGKDTEGHQSGRSLLALWEKGVNKNMRITGSRGRRPVLKNVTSSEVESFRKQVQLENLIGCENAKIIAKTVEKLFRSKAAFSLSECGCHDCRDEKSPLRLSGVSEIKVRKAKGVKLDKAGYFVIIPSKDNGIITVEHYNYDNKLLRVLVGRNSRDIYRTIIDNKWVTDLSHAAYIGKEIGRAEMAIKKGFKYVQEGA